MAGHTEPMRLSTIVSTPSSSDASSSNLANRATFDVHGFRFSVQGNAEAAVEGIREDFRYFSSGPGRDDLTPDKTTVELLRERPPLDCAPPGDALIYTPRNVVYRSGGKRYIDYHGRGLGILDEAASNFRLFSEDTELLYEAAYLFLLSRIGQALDQRRLHRLHALGVELNGRAVVVLLPMGGGKSTLALHLMNLPGVRLLSDDSPWIDRAGRVLAYPLHIGLLPGSEQSVPEQNRRVIQRMEFGPKHLVNFSYFQERVCGSAEPGVVFIGARTLLSECRIEEVGMAAALRPVIANGVIGLGLFQGLEFILQSSALELFKKTGLGISRMSNCWRLLRRSRICRVHLGRDAELNARTILQFTRKLFS
jgi:hypothetical protein